MQNNKRQQILFWIIYILALGTTFNLADAGSHSGSDTLIRFALPFIFISLLANHHIRQLRK